MHRMSDAGIYMVTAGTYQKKPIFNTPEKLSLVRDIDYSSGFEMPENVKLTWQRFVVLGAFAIAIVELEEGYHMLSNLIGVEPEDVAIGTPLEVFFEEMSEEITLPYFRVRSQG